MSEQKPRLEDLRMCSRTCVNLGVSCPKENSDCRYWIDHEDDLNCTFVAIYNNAGKEMSLREVAERVGVSHVWVGKIEERVVKTLKNRLKEYAP